MLLRQREAGSMLDRVASRALGLGCAVFLLALRLAAAPAALGNLLATPGNAEVTVTSNAVIGATSNNSIVVGTQLFATAYYAVLVYGPITAFSMLGDDD